MTQVNQMVGLLVMVRKRFITISANCMTSNVRLPGPEFSDPSFSAPSVRACQ